MLGKHHLHKGNNCLAQVPVPVLCGSPFRDFNLEQDGPSLESSSYLNVSLRYHGPGDLGTPGPWNPSILGLLDLFPPPTPPHTSPYILLPPPISSFYSPPLVWFGYLWGGEMSCDN